MYTYYVNTSPHSSLFPYLCVYVFVTDIHLCVYHYPQYIELFAQFCLFAQCNQSSNHNGHFLNLPFLLLPVTACFLD